MNMDSFTLLNALFLTEHAFLPLFPDGRSALQHTLDRVRQTAGGRIYLFIPESFRIRVESSLKLPEGCSIIARDSWDSEIFLSLLTRCRDEAAAAAPDPADGGNLPYFLHIHADAPLYDEEILKRMVENHIRYRATYTFADAYPALLAPEVLSCPVLDQISTLYRSQVEKGVHFPLSDTLFFDIIQKDINAFDIETEIAPEDMRLLRVKLAARGKRNYLLMKELVSRGGRDADSILPLLKEHPEMLRTLPAFVYIQATAACPQHCLFCPYPDFPGNPREHAEKYLQTSSMEDLAARVEAFCGDAWVSLSLWGDLSLHPEAPQMIKAVLDRKGLSLLIETSGVGWKLSDLQAAAQLPGRERISWIISLDAYHEATYRNIRGPGMAEALDTVKTLAELFPGQVHVQAVRTMENEEELETFYRFWKNEGVEVIIQKYSTFAGSLPERKVSDLSPINRFPCWHIKRDLHILLDGTVPLCRELLPGREDYPSLLLGNVFQESLETIWDRGRDIYLTHIKEEYPPLCGACDEYYTYTF